MSNKRALGRIPSKRTDPNLNDGEFLGRIFHLQVPNIGPIKLERLPPRRARDAGHLEIDRHEIAFLDSGSEIGERGFEVGFGHFLHGYVGRGGRRREGAS